MSNFETFLASVGALSIIAAIILIIFRVIAYADEHKDLKQKTKYLVKEIQDMPNYSFVDRNIRETKEELEKKMSEMEKELNEKLSGIDKRVSFYTDNIDILKRMPYPPMGDPLENPLITFTESDKTNPI